MQVCPYKKNIHFACDSFHILNKQCADNICHVLGLYNEMWFYMYWYCAPNAIQYCLAILLELLLVNDTLDDILQDSGDEEEEDAIVTKVLDEIGIEITEKVCFFYLTLYWIFFIVDIL